MGIHEPHMHSPAVQTNVYVDTFKKYQKRKGTFLIKILHLFRKNGSKVQKLTESQGIMLCINI